MEEDENLPIILGRPFLATEMMVIDVYKGELTMRVKDQTISFNVFKKVDSPSSIDECYRMDLMKENIEKNSLKEALLISHESSIVHSVEVEVKKAQENTSVVEASQHSFKSNPLIRVMMSSLSSSSHHKPNKKDKRKQKTKKKSKHSDHHFELGLRGVLGSSCLKLFLGMLKARWSRPFEETNLSPYTVTRRIKLNIRKLKECLEGYLDHAKSSIALPNPS
ncbi:hypothetical protein PanWU01x14_178660 [Parasponia andersonii]|uniref:Uncharacterized protein n=1 Tax=Parasponia andersonii TaxID=3476 RepID=A0A2P5C713_PARAD|nr:hypothetical protein PanWU01x14_178660 [Parasponia andersonii]